MIESELFFEYLKDRPAPHLPLCECGSIAEPTYNRGQVLSRWRRFLGLPCSACICPECHRTVGWESC